MEAQSIIWAVVVLLIVLALIGITARVVRALGLVSGVPALGKRQRRLRVIEATSIDTRHRMVLVGRDDRAHLILLGPSGDLVIERDIALPPEPEVEPAAALSEPEATS